MTRTGLHATIQKAGADSRGIHSVVCQSDASLRGHLILIVERSLLFWGGSVAFPVRLCRSIFELTITDASAAPTYCKYPSHLFDFRPKMTSCISIDSFTASTIPKPTSHPRSPAPRSNSRTISHSHYSTIPMRTYSFSTTCSKALGSVLRWRRTKERRQMWRWEYLASISRTR